jgi:hypothetical protein
MLFYKTKYGTTKHYSTDILVAQEIHKISPRANGGKSTTVYDIYLSKKSPVAEPILKTDGEDYYFRVLPIKKEDEVNQISFFVSGCSGSGKSHFVGELIGRLQREIPYYSSEETKAEKKEREKKQKESRWYNQPSRRDEGKDIEPDKFPVYIVSGQPIDGPDDPAFKKNIREYIKIDINHPDFLSLSWTDFKHSIVIFDDVTAIEDDNIQKHILKIQKSILQNARKSEIISVSIGHTLQDYIRTKYILDESVYVTVFPQSDYDAVRNLFLNKFGFTREKTEMLLDLDTRALTLYRHYPNMYFSDYQLGLLHPKKKML